MKPINVRILGVLAGAITALVLGFFFFGSTPAQAKPGGPAVASVNAVTIPGAPLSISVEPSGSYAVYRNSIQQFFGSEAEGAYLWVNGQVWGPETVPAGLAVNNYTQISSTLSGDGSASNPWVVTNVLGVGSTGLQLTQRVSYVNGQEFIRNDFAVCNTGGAITGDVHLFHAADLYTQGSDVGYGYYDAATGAIGGYTQARDLYQIFVPISAATHYEENYYDSIWSDIGDTGGLGTGFHNTLLPNDYIDNGAGLEWAFSAASGCVSRSDFLSFSGSPVIPTVGTPGSTTPTPSPTPVRTPNPTRRQPAQLRVSLAQDPDNTLAPNTVFTYTLKLDNKGPGYTSDTHATINFDPSIAILDFHSASSGVFVTNVSTNSVSIRFANIGANTTDYAYVIAKTNPASAIGAVSLSRASVHWVDSGTHDVLSDIVDANIAATTSDSGYHGLQRALYNAPSAAVKAGTQIALNADYYDSIEPVSMWINKPDGSVVAITNPAISDTDGRISLTIDTTGLAPGTYSLVAHGGYSGMEGIGVFTIQ